MGSTCTPKPVVIGPEKAKAYLAQNLSNRRLKPMWVKKYESEIRRGAWQDHSAIILSKHGKLLDGQHRLTAVVNTDTPAPFFVITTNITSPLGLAQDIGVARKARDYSVTSSSLTDMASLLMRICGKNEDQNPMTTAATAAALSDCIEVVLGEEALMLFGNGKNKPWTASSVRLGALAAAFVYGPESMEQAKAIKSKDYTKFNQYVSLYYGREHDSGFERRLDCDRICAIFQALNPECARLKKWYFKTDGAAQRAKNILAPIWADLAQS